MKAPIDFRGLGWLLLGVGVAGAAACGDGGGDDLNGATAGQPGKGGGAGQSGSGGSTAGSNAIGGSSAAGTSGSGAASGSGNAGSGGNAAGGTNSAGGGKAGLGGTNATAGGGAGGTGGSAGAPTAGSGGSGGATPTSGCMASDWPMAGTQMLSVEGTEREFIVALPEAYDPTQPHRLAFAFHGRTGTAEQIAGGARRGGYYGMSSRIGDSTVLVAPQGLGTDDDAEDTGWPNTGGRDIEFVRAMIDWLSQSYCIDASRIFSTGFSYGGIMSNTIGCQMPDVFRAIAPMAGAMFGRSGDCEQPPGIAVWMVHGTADETVTFEQGETARDVFLAKNGCDATTEPTPVEPEGCVEYQGCAEGTPLVWCTHDGAHVIPSFTQDGISDFFAGF